MSRARFASGRFEVLREIGRGGMGAVYEVYDRDHDLRVALKTVSRPGAHRVLQLKREFRAVSGLRHRNLVELYELSAGEAGYFFTMELLRGADVRAWVQRSSRAASHEAEAATLTQETGEALRAGGAIAGARAETATEAVSPTLGGASETDSEAVAPTPGGAADPAGADAIARTDVYAPTWTGADDGGARPGSGAPSPRAGDTDPSPALAEARIPSRVAFDEARLRRAIAELASGLAFLHARGVVHRDVKPSNALVDEERERVVLLDFGFAADWQPAPGRRAPSSPPVAGTIAYMAPEYLQGQVVSPALDAYALGVLIFELVTGAPPFSGSLYDIVTAHVESEPPRARDANPDVPADIERLIGELLAKDPASRPNAEDVRARALGDDASPAVPPAPALGAPPLFGRDDELAALDGALSAAKTGGLRVAAVEGDAGAGKTALLDAFVRRLPTREVVVFRGRCHRREGVPYRAFDEIAEELASDVSEAERAAGDDLDLSRRVSSLARVFSAFAAAADADADAPPPADARDERERALAEFADLLAYRLDGAPGVLAIDDLQWADAESLELLSVLCERAAELPVVIAVTIRRSRGSDAIPGVDEFLAWAQRRGHAVRPGLPPLPRPAIRTLVESIAQTAIDDDLARAVERAAGGLPYAAAAIAHELGRRGPAAIAPDVDVRELEEARIRRLGADEERVAEAAAVAAGATSFAELRAIADLPGPRLLSALHELERERVLGATPTAEAEPGYDFCHERLRDRVTARLSAHERGRLHRRAAAFLESAGPRAAERQSRQWELAGEPARAALAARAAADEARRQLAFERAAALYDRALGLDPEGETRERALEGRAEALLLSNDFEGAAARCAELADERAGLERDRWRVRSAEAALKLGDVEAGVRGLEDVLAPRGLAIRKPAPVAVARAAAVGGRLVLPPRRRPAPADSAKAGAAGAGAPSAALREDAVLSDAYRVAAYFLSTPVPREAWEFVLRFVDDARARGDRAREASGFAMVSGYLEIASLGRVGAHFFGRARRAAAAAGDPYADLVIEAVGVMRATVAGDWDDMRRRAARGADLCERMGMAGSWEASFLRTYHGLAEMYAGEIDSALAVLDALFEGRRRPDLFTRTLATITYGRALALAGRTDDAEGLVSEIASSPLARYDAIAMWTAICRGEVALARGDYGAAVEWADAVRRRGRRTGLAFWPVFAAMRHALAATGHVGRARAGGAPARAASRRAGRHAAALYALARGSFYEPTALRLLAQARAARGESAGARKTLARAERSAARRGGRLEREATAALGGRGPIASAPLAALTAGEPRPL